MLTDRITDAITLAPRRTPMTSERTITLFDGPLAGSNVRGPFSVYETERWITDRNGDRHLYSFIGGQGIYKRSRSKARYNITNTFERRYADEN